MTEFVDRQTLAEKIGVSTRRIGQLVSEGKLSAPTAKGFDLAKAVGEYQLRTDPAKRQAALVAKGDAARAPIAVAKPARSAPAPAPDDDESDDPDLFDFQEARAKREQHNADLAELKLMQARGELLRREVIVAREFEIARKLRERILGFPARLANFVPPEAMKAITDECESLVVELQEEASRIAESSIE